MARGPAPTLADLCAAEGITVVLGHALAMTAIHGGKAKNDKIDSHQIAVLRRGGLLAHIQNTRAQYNLPAFERRLATQGIARVWSSTFRTRACARASRWT